MEELNSLVDWARAAFSSPFFPLMFWDFRSVRAFIRAFFRSLIRAFASTPFLCLDARTGFRGGGWFLEGVVLFLGEVNLEYIMVRFLGTWFDLQTFLRIMLMDGPS